jgi:hypothetical protein
MVFGRALIILFLALSFPVFATETVDVKSLDVSNITTVVTVTTSATPLPATALSGRKTILVQNVTSTAVYLGNADVTADEAATGGYQLTNDGDTWIGDFTDENIVYGIVATGTGTLCVWEAR